MGLRDMFVGGPNSLGGRARARRWELVAATFPDISDYDVLDLGGTPASWLSAPVQPRSVTVLNFADWELTNADGVSTLPTWIEVVLGDACDPPQPVLDRQFDLVFSNSLIEHVGGPHRRSELAGVVRRMATRCWLQTPYRYFPIEPHWIFPGFQFLPLRTRGWLSRHWPLTPTRAESVAAGINSALDVELMSVTELRHILPEAHIVFERFCGLPKSLIAIRR